MFTTKWIKEGRVFQKSTQQQHQEEIRPTNKGYYKILEDTEDLNNVNGIAYHVAKDMQYDDVKYENTTIKKKNKELAEKYDIEQMTVDTL